MPRASADFDVEVFFDGECPLCMREIRMLQRRDRQGRIRFTDIASPTFQPAEYGKDQASFMAKIHGRLPDGTWLEGVEVFRRLYTAIGFGALAGVTRLPGIAQLADLAYESFAKNRLRLTGRCVKDASGACELPPVKA